MKWSACRPVLASLLLVAGLAVPAGLRGQAADHDHDASHAHATGPALRSTDPRADTALSSTALAQIRVVERSVADFSSPAAARTAGFRPALGMIPTMGTHWVSLERMRTGTGSNLERPEHLMFSPIDGADRLVGVAFAYQARPGQPTPDLFDGGSDAWHTHPELSPPGQELTMLHVWFVPSPDGPFAGHNPWLAYWAAGLEPPDASRLADPADSYRIRALGLALAETVDAGRDERLLALLVESNGANTEAQRERIRTLVPRLESAQSSGDVIAWNAAADEAVAAWEEIRSTNLASIRIPFLRQRLGAFYEEMLTGGHGAH
jgi:hypothetical protein